LLLTALFMAYVLVHALLRPRSAAAKGAADLAEFGVALSDLLPFVVVIGGTMGSLYFGWATPTEGRRHRAASPVVVRRFWGKLAGRAQAGHDLLVMTRQHPCYRLTAIVFPMPISVAGVGEQLTPGWSDESVAAGILFPVHPLHDPGLPGRKPGHDRDHRAAALIRCC